MDTLKLIKDEQELIAFDVEVEIGRLVDFGNVPPENYERVRELSNRLQMIRYAIAVVDQYID